MAYHFQLDSSICLAVVALEKNEALVPRTPGARIDAVLPFYRQQVGTWECYAGFENPAKSVGPTTINKFALLTRRCAELACFLCSQLVRHTLTPQTAVLTYANPSRGDVSPMSGRVTYEWPR